MTAPVSLREWMAAWHAAPHAHQTVAEQAVILAVALYADPDSGGGIRPAQATVAAQVGASVSTVGRAVRGAVADGWLWEVVPGGGRRRPAVYRLAVPSLRVADLGFAVTQAARAVARTTSPVP